MQYGNDKLISLFAGEQDTIYAAELYNGFVLIIKS